MLAQDKILFTHGYLHVGNGETIASASIGIEKGKIVLLKNSLAHTFDPKEWDTVIHLNGQHVYPGFIAPNSTLGLTEIDAVRATNDFHEVGTFNPQIRSQIAYNVESNVISTVKTNGVLFCQPTPRGGIISGTSSIMACDGWNWEDATIFKDDGIHVNWPSSYFISEQKEEREEAYRLKVNELKQFFQEAKNYERTHGTNNLRFDAMRSCFKGEKRVYFHANLIQELLDIIDFSQQLELAHPVIIGGDEAIPIANRLKDAKIPLMLNRIHNLPHTEDGAIHENFTLPFYLQQKGILFCLQNEGDMEAMQARNLPFLAGSAQAYGLSEEEAISSITLNTAKIMGIDQQYGSIEIGKDASLFVSKGNALDMRTNQVSLALIHGKFISLKNHQTELFLKYSKKYESQKK